MNHFTQGCWYRTVPAGTAGILRTGRWTGTETPSKCTAQDTGLYRTIPAVSEYTGRFGRKREIRPVQKLKEKNRRNAWFEQTLVQQVATTLTSSIRSSSSFFCSSSRLLSFSIALICSLFLLNNEHCYAVSPSLFCAIWNFLSPFTRD